MLLDIKKSDVGERLDDSMIPAINVIFLLLVFFMIVGHIEARNDQLLIPESSSQIDVAEQRVEIQILANGQQLIDGHRVEGSLLDALKSRQIPSDAVVTCHIHRALPATALNPVLGAVRSLGIRHLQIVTNQQQ